MIKYIYLGQVTFSHKMNNRESTKEGLKSVVTLAGTPNIDLACELDVLFNMLREKNPIPEEDIIQRRIQGIVSYYADVEGKVFPDPVDYEKVLQEFWQANKVQMIPLLLATCLTWYGFESNERKGDPFLRKLLPMNLVYQRVQGYDLIVLDLYNHMGKSEKEPHLPPLEKTDEAIDDDDYTDYIDDGSSDTESEIDKPKFDINNIFWGSPIAALSQIPNSSFEVQKPHVKAPLADDDFICDSCRSKTCVWFHSLNKSYDLCAICYVSAEEGHKSDLVYSREYFGGNTYDNTDTIASFTLPQEWFVQT